MPADGVLVNLEVFQCDLFLLAELKISFSAGKRINKSFY